MVVIESITHRLVARFMLFRMLYEMCESVELLASKGFQSECTKIGNAKMIENCWHASWNFDSCGSSEFGQTLVNDVAAIDAFCVEIFFDILGSLGGMGK